VEAVAASGANLLLAGLGERQEVFLWRHKRRLGVPVMIGVGGTLDVLAGEARRMPRWSQRLGVEWLLRVGLDPKRWPRALRLARFVAAVERARHLTPPPG
jgi:N-acetylglucosaminyldiphosphoundecaprenol N-acetyl-beta-D-mannosaminyltransferase